MAMRIYVGVNNTAKLIKSIYIGVNGIAKRVKYGYIGVNGIARKFYQWPNIAYKPNVSMQKLSQARVKIASTSIGKYAIFGGGGNSEAGISTSVYSTVDVYDSSLSKVSCSALGTAREMAAAGTVAEKYAIFAGGWTVSARNPVNNTDAYNTSLTKISISSLSNARHQAFTAATGNYILIAGGYHNGEQSVVETYNANLTKSTTHALSKRRGDGRGTTVGKYALFAGGWSNSVYMDATDAYDQSLTKIDVSRLDVGSSEAAFVTIANKYALYAGGSINDASTTDNVVVFNDSLTKTIASDLMSPRYRLSGTTLYGKKIAIFGGGNMLTPSHSYYTKYADLYDMDLVRTTPPSLSVATNRLGAACAGSKYAIFAGGSGSSGNSSTVDVYAY